MKKQLFKSVKAILTMLVMTMMFPVVSMAAGYDYKNDTTAYVFPGWNGDISNDFSVDFGDAPRMKGDLFCTASYTGENTINFSQNYEYGYGNFVKKNVTEATYGVYGKGYVSTKVYDIKLYLGVPLNVHLTQGMLEAYQNQTNTIYIRDDEGPQAEDYSSYFKDGKLNLIDGKIDWDRFNREGDEWTRQRVQYIREKVKNQKNTANATGASASAVEALKTASVNNAEFNAFTYYTNYKDLQTAIGADANALYNHWISFGKAEGRKAN